MTHEQKLQVKNALIRYTERFDTQILAAASLQGISSGTISHIKNNNWEVLDERVWPLLARQVGFYCGDWHPADTCGYLLLRILFSDAQNYAMAYGIAVSTGLGKTFTASHYRREHEHVHYMACNDTFNRRTFITSLMQCAGLDATGTTPELIKAYITHIRNQDAPLIILDDTHLLKDRVLHLVVSLTNALTGSAGVVIMGNDELRIRIVEGTRARKTGYEEIYNTFGRRFITLGKLGPKDAELVCRANGVNDEQHIAEITSECRGNLHHIATIISRGRDMRVAA